MARPWFADGLKRNGLVSGVRLLVGLVLAWAVPPVIGEDLERLRYHHPGLIVDLGVGLYASPLPVDFDEDGDLDLLLSCPDKPFNGLYFCENPAGSGKNEKHPIFRAPRRISRGLPNVRVSTVHGRDRILGPAVEFLDFRRKGLDSPQPWLLPFDVHPAVGRHDKKLRANQWQLVDYDGDGDHDLVIGVDDWSDYGWDDAYNADGEWTNGRLHGFVYLMRNQGTDQLPDYAAPQRLQITDGDIDVYGWPSPCLADFDKDGDLDLVCGEFLDRFHYFENQGTRAEPRYAPSRPLAYAGKPLQMDLQMILPVSVDWDRDGDVDLIVGDEDGRVALLENTGRLVENQPEFLPPFYFQQEADFVKCGALATPCAFDWDGDGDDDLVSGNTAGYLEWLENLGPVAGQTTPRWMAPRRLLADDRVIRIQAGNNGSIQGPCEAKWGYTTLHIADWDADGLPDVMINSIWGRLQWFRNVGTRQAPRLAAAQDVRVDWPSNEPPKPAWNWWNPEPHQLVTQWRTTPVMIDWDRDQQLDLVVLDHEGFLALYPRKASADAPTLLPGQRIFLNEQGEPLRVNDRRAGGSGRYKIHLVDWDQDGLIDLLVNGTTNIHWYRQLPGATDTRVTLALQGPLAQRDISSHSPCPTTADWNGNSIPDLVVGAEDGHFYFLLR